MVFKDFAIALLVVLVVYLYDSHFECSISNDSSVVFHN